MRDQRVPTPLGVAVSLVPAAEQTAKILLIDGDSQLAKTVIGAMDGGECELRVHSQPTHIHEAISEYAPDLILIDVNVKDGGLALCGELRSTQATGRVPIMILAPGPFDEPLMTRGLLCGADDFVCLGERVAEFQVRVRVQLRNKRDRDRLQRVRAERDVLRREATLDPLTSLMNRRSLDACIEDEWSKGRRFAVVFIDVDDFKQVNDGYGHDVGDRVLKAVASSLVTLLREGAKCGRWGGEEFVMVLPGASAVEALAAAETQRRGLEMIRVTELGTRAVSASFGVAAFDPSAPDASWESLCQRADAALYEAKRSGKNRVCSARSMVGRAGHVSIRVGSSSQAPGSAPGMDAAGLEAALIKELATGRAGLPVLPEAAQQALKLAEDPRTDMAGIAKLVDRDPPLAARFIAVAGSALYARGVKPATMQAALVRIGLATARDLLLQIAYERSSQDLPVFRTEVARSFERSVRAAIAARLLTAELRIQYESAYLCGLLHDIGEARIYRILSQIPLAMERPELAAELVARHHQRAGADVARAWRLSPEIVDACAGHHGASAPTMAVKLVMGADILVRLLEAEEAPTDVERATMMRTVGVHPDRIADLVQRLKLALGPPEGAQSQQDQALVEEARLRRDSGRHGRVADGSRYPRPPSLNRIQIRVR